MLLFSIFALVIIIATFIVDKYDKWGKFKMEMISVRIIFVGLLVLHLLLFGILRNDVSQVNEKIDAYEQTFQGELSEYEEYFRIQKAYEINEIIIRIKRYNQGYADIAYDDDDVESLELIEIN